MIKVNNKVLCEHCFAETDMEPCPECGFDSNTYICDPMTLRAGSILAGRYAIGRVIGKGGFGITYLAYDLKLECRVAVKEYYPYGLAVRFPGSTQVSVTAAQAEETFKAGADKFYDEARLVAQFNGNPNIVSVSDFFYENDTVYFIMGYLDGQTLKDYLKEHGALTPGQAVYVADAVSNALTAAHGRNVLHRDISPDNIMVCRDGSIKLLDFGAARQVLTEGSQSLSVILKQGFAPLEQYQKKGKQGPWTDIYSLGATLYHALTLDTLDDPMSRMEGDEEYHSNVHGIEEELWRIIKKATMLKSADRYQDVFELRKDMGSLSIEPVPLTVAGAADGGRHGAAASVHSSAGHAVSAGVTDSAGVHAGAVGEEESARVCSETAGEEEASVNFKSAVEDDIGVTMPLREGDVGVTMPLQEGDIRVTVPLQEGDVGVAIPLNEEKDAGNSNAVRESGKAEAEKARTGTESKKYGIWSAAICLVIQSVVAVLVVNITLPNIGGTGRTFEQVVSLYRNYGRVDELYANYIFMIFQAMAVIGGVVFFSLTPYLPTAYKNRKAGHRMKIKMVWLAGVVIQIVAGMVVLERMMAHYARYMLGAINYVASLGFVVTLLEGVAVCIWGIFIAGKVFREDKDYEGKYHRIINYTTVLLYFGYIALNFFVLYFNSNNCRRSSW